MTVDRQLLEELQGSMAKVEAHRIFPHAVELFS